MKKLAELVVMGAIALGSYCSTLAPEPDFTKQEATSLMAYKLTKMGYKQNSPVTKPGEFTTNTSTLVIDGTVVKSVKVDVEVECIDSYIYLEYVWENDNEASIDSIVALAERCGRLFYKINSTNKESNLENLVESSVP